MEHSPFAGGPGWEIEYEEYKLCDMGRPSMWLNSHNQERDKRLIYMIKKHKFLTMSQIESSPALSSYAGVDKRLVNQYVKGKFIEKHKIKNGNREIPVYTAGVAMFYCDYTFRVNPGLIRKYSLVDVLKILSVNNLLIKISDTKKVDFTFWDVLPPYTSKMVVQGKEGEAGLETKIISIRKYDAEIAEMKRVLPQINERCILLGDSEETLLKLIDHYPDNGKVLLTTDDRLFKNSLTECFMVVKNKELKDVNIVI